LSEDISSGSSEHDDDSTWDPRDIKYNNITDDSFNNGNFDNEGDQDDSDRESLHSADSTDQVKTKPQFDHRDIVVLKSTNGLLSPGDILSYRLRTPRGEPKSSTITSLLDPSTPDKKLITLENGVILKPFVHDVKRQKMYGGGACGHLTDPLSVWMKMEQCTLFVGCTSNLLQLMNMTITSTPPMGMSLMIATPPNVLIWMVSIQQTLYMERVLNVLSTKLTLSQQTILSRHQLKQTHEQMWSEGTYQ
jgi:hypothetical protein